MNLFRLFVFFLVFMLYGCSITGKGWKFASEAIQVQSNTDVVSLLSGDFFE